MSSILISTLSSELREEQRQLLDKGLELKKEEDLTKKLLAKNRISDWKKYSLPAAAHSKEDVAKGKAANDEAKPHFANVQVKYENYLRNLMHHSGFSGVPDITTKPPDSRTGPTTGNKIPIYTRFPFTVKVQGSLAAVEKMLGDLLQAIRCCKR